MNNDNQPQLIKFSKEFTAKIEEYIAIYKKQGKKPSVSGFANRIGTNEESIYAWANKKLKDEQGNVTEELARPNFHAAVKRLEAIQNEPEEVNLNPKQELFCQLYATSREHFGNATQSYAIAYGIDVDNKEAYANARISASTLLTKINILKRVDELLRDINDDIVDQELAFVIMQRYELPSKMAAIREYNKVKKRVTNKLGLELDDDEGSTVQVVGFTIIQPVKDVTTNNADNQANT